MERIEIDVYEKQQGFGWAIDCSDCGYRERMLSKEGAIRLGWDHKDAHKPIVTITPQA